MKIRMSKSLLAALAGSLYMAAHAAPAGGASTPSANPAPGTAGTPGQTSTVPGTPGSPAPGAQVDTQATTAGANSAMAGEYSDPEIVALILTVDENEIKAAEAARKEKMGKDAQDFAKMMIKQHREDSSKVAKLAKREKIDPAMTAAKVQELRDKGAADLQALAGKDSLEFEQAYISAMVQGHGEVLALLDEHLIKEADSPKLKKQLESTRKHVSNHLERAKRLQGSQAAR